MPWYAPAFGQWPHWANAGSALEKSFRAMGWVETDGTIPTPGVPPDPAAARLVKAINGKLADIAGGITLAAADVGAIPVPGGTAAVGQVVAATQVDGAGKPTAFGLAVVPPQTVAYYATVESGDVVTHNLTTGRRTKATTGAGIIGPLTVVGDAVILDVAGEPSWVPATGGDIRAVAADPTIWAGWGSSTIAGLASFLSDLAAARGVTYYDGGVGGEYIEHALARYGSRRATIAAVTIPDSGSVNVTLQGFPAYDKAFSATVTIAGIEGTLTKAAGATGNPYVFTRTAAGSATAVAAGTPAVPVNGTAHRHAEVILLNLGKNNIDGQIGADDVATLVEWTRDAYNWAGALARHVLILGHFNNTDYTAADPRRTVVDGYNAALHREFGERFIDVSALLTDPDVWAAVGITPTTADLAQQALGNKPDSLSADNWHLNSTGYQLLHDEIEERITALGWAIAVVTNLVNNPRVGVGTTDWTSPAGTGGAVIRSRQASGGPLTDAPTYHRTEWTTAPSGPSGIQAFNGATTSNLATAGTEYRYLCYARASWAASIRASISWYNGATFVSPIAPSAYVTLTPGEWVSFEVVATAPATVTRAQLAVSLNSTSAAPGVGGTLDVSAFMLHKTLPGGITVPYGDGDSVGWAWTGTAHASPSTGPAE